MGPTDGMYTISHIIWSRHEFQELFKKGHSAHNKTFYLPDHFITGTLVIGWRIGYVLDFM